MPLIIIINLLLYVFFLFSFIYILTSPIIGIGIVIMYIICEGNRYILSRETDTRSIIDHQLPMLFCSVVVGVECTLLLSRSL